MESRFRILYFFQVSVPYGICLLFIFMLWKYSPIDSTQKGIPVMYIFFFGVFMIPLVFALTLKKIILTKTEIIIRNLITQRARVILYSDIKTAGMSLHRIQMEARTTDPYESFSFETKQGVSYSFSQNEYQNYYELKSYIYKSIKLNKAASNNNLSNGSL